MRMNVASILEPEVIQCMPREAVERIDGVLAACYEQAVTGGEEEAAAREKEVGVLRQQLEEMTRRLLEGEMEMSRLRAEGAPRVECKLPPYTHRQHFLLVSKLKDANIKLKKVIKEKKGLETQINFLINGETGSRKEVLSEMEENGVEVDGVSAELVGLRRAVKEYQNFIYKKEQECYSLMIKNTDLLSENTFLKSFKEKYLNLYDLYLKRQLQLRDYKNQVGEQKKFIDEREAFFLRSLNALTSNSPLINSLNDILRKMRGEESTEPGYGVACELSSIHREVAGLQHVILCIKDVIRELRDFVSVSCLGNKADTNEELKVYKAEYDIAVEENRELKEHLESTLREEKDAIKLERDVKEYAKQLQYNEETISTAQKELQVLRECVESYRKFARKVNMLLARYRKLKEVFVEGSNEQIQGTAG